MDIRRCFASGIGTVVFFIFCSLVLLAGVLSPSSATTLSLTPAEAIIYEHNVANFFCSANEKITYIEWMLNGTNLRDMKVDNPKASMQDTFGTLIFSGFSARYNQTAIKCTVWIASNNEMFTSEEAIIRVQGRLPLVTNLIDTYISSNRTLLLSWDRPHAIAVPPESEPSINYYLSINDGISESVTTISNATFYRVLNLGCEDGYVITIRPMNAVGVSESTVVEFPGKFEINSQSNTPYLSGGNYIYEFVVTSGMVCQCNALYMEQAQTLRCVPSTHEGHKIELSTIGLVAANTKFTVSLDVSNRQYSLNLKAGLSTFDVQDIFVSTSLENLVTTTSYKVTFVGNSLAIGAVIMFLLKVAEYNCERSSFFLQNKDSAEVFNNFTSGISDGNYIVRVYDIEENGEVFSMKPAVSKSLAIRGTGSSLNPSGSCSAMSVHQGASVQCSMHFQATMGYTAALIPSEATSGDPGNFSTASTNSFSLPFEVRTGTVGRHCLVVFPLLTRQLQVSRPIFKTQVTLMLVPAPTTAAGISTNHTGFSIQGSRQQDQQPNSSKDMIIGLSVGLPLLVVIAIASILMALVALFMYKRKKRKSRKGKDLESESDANSQHGTVSSRVEKISKHSTRKKRGRSDFIDDTSEGIPQAKSESDKSSIRSPKKKRRKSSVDRFGHITNQVTPATDLEFMRGSVKPGAIGDGRHGNRNSRSHSLGNELKMGDMLQKSRRKSTGIGMGMDKDIRHNHKDQRSNLNSNLMESTNKPKGLRQGSGLMALRDINGSTTGSNRTLPKRRKTLGQFTAESLETTGTIPNDTGYPNEMSDSAATYMKQKRKSLTVVSNTQVDRRLSGSRAETQAGGFYEANTKHNDLHVRSPGLENARSLRRPRSPARSPMPGQIQLPNAPLPPHKPAAAATAKLSSSKLPPLSPPSTAATRPSSYGGYSSALYGTSTTDGRPSSF